MNELKFKEKNQDEELNNLDNLQKESTNKDYQTEYHSENDNILLSDDHLE